MKTSHRDNELLQLVVKAWVGSRKGVIAMYHDRNVEQIGMGCGGKGKIRSNGPLETSTCSDS